MANHIVSGLAYKVMKAMSYYISEQRKLSSSNPFCISICSGFQMGLENLACCPTRWQVE